MMIELFLCVAVGIQIPMIAFCIFSIYQLNTKIEDSTYMDADMHRNFAMLTEKYNLLARQMADLAERHLNLLDRHIEDLRNEDKKVS